MSADQLIVTLAGLMAIAGVAWFFWGPRGEGVKAALTSAGVQEAMILVKGGYTPDTVVVEAGTPVRLNFRRDALPGDEPSPRPSPATRRGCPRARGRRCR